MLSKFSRTCKANSVLAHVSKCRRLFPIRVVIRGSRDVRMVQCRYYWRAMLKGIAPLLVKGRQLLLGMIQFIIWREGVRVRVFSDRHQSVSLRMELLIYRDQRLPKAEKLNH